MKVVVIGATGRMGGLACELIAEAPELEVCARLCSSDLLEAGLAKSGAEVGIDLTVAGRGCCHGLAMIEAGIRPVIGTSGMSLEDDRQLDQAARTAGLGGLVVPNFSLGVWLLNRAAEDAARHLKSFEIIELHNQRKQDAPSGTALDTAARLAARVPGRRPEDVPIHSVRIEGLHSNQEVIFGGPGEVLRLRHETYGLECFGPGMLAALRFAATAVGVGRGIGLALENS